MREVRGCADGAGSLPGSVNLTSDAAKPRLLAGSGGRSSMVEPQIVVLDVAGSSPVDHPIFAGGENAAPKHSEGGLESNTASSGGRRCKRRWWSAGPCGWMI